MHLLDNYSQSFIATNQQRVDAQREQFKVNSVSIANNKFNITVQNTGQVPINITRIWIQDTTTSTSPTRYTVSQSVAPNGILKNIGQGSAFPTASSTDTYSMQLVTGRGNTQQFSVNSVGSAPLNIQLYAFPSTIPSDFTTELVMIVTNNQTGTLANLIPTITKDGSSTAACIPSVASTPPSVSALAPGSTAVFKWDLKMTGSDGKKCTYIASLTNGFPGNTASTTATINSITATSSNWSTTWGILSLNYTSLQWTQNNGTTWNTNWSVPKGPNCNSCIVWRVDITNNDPTRSFIFNGNSTLVAFGTSSGSNSAYQWYLIRNDYPAIHGYSLNGQTLAANSTTKLYFGASMAAGNTGVYIDKAGQYAISVLLFGYWNSVASNNFFGQNIPYEGIIAS